jgi:hypothetical protein
MIHSNHTNYSLRKLADTLNGVCFVIPTGVQMHTVGSQKRYAANDINPTEGHCHSNKMCEGKRLSIMPPSLLAESWSSLE